MKGIDDLVDAVVAASNSPITKTTVKAVIKSVFANVLELAKQDEEGVRIPEFGTFAITERSERSERAGRNPITGEPITIQASKSLKFKTAKATRKVEV